MEKIPQGERERGGGDSGLRPNSERRNLHGSSSSSYYVLKAAHTRAEREGKAITRGRSRRGERREEKARESREGGRRGLTARSIDKAEKNERSPQQSESE